MVIICRTWKDDLKCENFKEEDAHKIVSSHKPDPIEVNFSKILELKNYRCKEEVIKLKRWYGTVREKYQETNTVICKEGKMRNGIKDNWSCSKREDYYGINCVGADTGNTLWGFEVVYDL